MFIVKRFTQLFGFLLLILCFQIVLLLNAQTECESLVINSFEALSDTCVSLDGSSACTTTNGEIVFVADLNTFSTTTNNDVLEVGRMNISANIPLGLSETGLQLLLIGDVTIENQVDPATAFEPSVGATVNTIVGANIRSFPSADGRLVTTAPVGTELIADGLSSDLEWLRVITESGTAWISRQIITPIEGDLDSLPVITNDTRTLWQEMTLSTTNSSGCGNDFPSMLYIQSPDNMLTTLTINNIEMRINSDVVLQIDENNIMNLYTIEGFGISDGVTVPAGFTMSIQLAEDGFDRDGSWTNLRPIDETERAFLSGLELIPADGLYRVIEIPTPDEVSELLSALNQVSAGAGQTIVTSAGEGIVDCSLLKPTSPLDEISPGVIPFYWDAANGAEAYNLNFFDVGGTFLGSVSVDALSPTFQIDPGDFIGGRGQFAWSVDAVISGEVACSTGRAIVQRSGGAQPVSDNNSSEAAPEPTKCLWNRC